MKIIVASKNQVKVEAVKEAIQDYDFLAKAEIFSSEPSSNVSGQPKSLDETINGAMNRAKNAFKKCNYSFGVESGFIRVSKTKTGYMNVTACAIYDGKNYHIGLSSAFECPLKVTKLIFEEGVDLNQAFYNVGLTKNPKLGSSEGAISILTKGRLTRKEYTKQAITMALINLENSI